MLSIWTSVSEKNRPVAKHDKKLLPHTCFARDVGPERRVLLRISQSPTSLTSIVLDVILAS